MSNNTNQDKDFLEEFSEEALHVECGLPHRTGIPTRTIEDQAGHELSSGLGIVSVEQSGVWSFEPVPQGIPDMPEHEPIFLRHPDGTRDRLWNFQVCPTPGTIHFHFRTDPLFE